MIRRRSTAVAFAFLASISTAFAQIVAVLRVPTPPSEVQIVGTTISDSNVGNSNLLISTNCLDNSCGDGATYWTTSLLTAAYGVTAPAGASVASSITENGNGVHSIVQNFAKAASTAATFNVSVVAAQSLRTRILIQIANPTNSSGAFIGFDLAGVQVAYGPTSFGSNFTMSSPTIQACTVALCNGTSGGYVLATVQVSISSSETNTSGEYRIHTDSGSGTAAASTNYNGNGSSPALNIASTMITNAAGSGNGLANAFDGDFTTWTDSSSYSSWIGIDTGSGNTATFTRWKWAPESGDANTALRDFIYDYEHNSATAQVQISNDPTFATGVSTIDTVPTFPYFARHQYNVRSITASSRAIRLAMPPQAYGAVAELRFFAQYGTVPTARPVPPTIAPWGGHFPAGIATINLASTTRSAVNYCTTDGSTPSNSNGVLELPQFTLTIGSATVTLQCVAYDPKLSTPLSEISSAVFHNYGFAPKDLIYDCNGNEVEAFDGEIKYFNGLYYWLGALTNKVTADTNEFRSTEGVWMYSAPDLQNNCWTLVGQLLPNPSTQFDILVRPHMLYNAANNNWVLWARVYEALHTSTSAAAVATCTTITGPCSWVNGDLNIDNNTPGDLNLFLDGDGNGYVIYHDTVHNTVNISQLTSNFQNTNGSSVTAISSAREGPVLFKQAGTYFVITSSLGGYNSGGTNFTLNYTASTAATPLSGWSGSSGSSIWQGGGYPGANANYNGQSTFVIQPQGKTQSYLLGTDWWVHNDVGSSSEVWAPMTFPTSTTLQVTQPATWDLSTLNFLLKRDIAPSSNDNSPMFLSEAA